jgi:hypothetical protein
MASLKGAGTEDKKKVAIAAALGVAVLALAIHTIFSGPSATPFQSTAQVQPIAVSSPSTGADENPDERRASTRSEAAIDPHLHPEWMAENENYLYTTSNPSKGRCGPPWRLPQPRVRQQGRRRSTSNSSAMWLRRMADHAVLFYWQATMCSWLEWETS